MTPESNEKRKYHRVSANCEINFALGPEPVESKRTYFKVRAKDISAQGIAFEFSKELPMGTFLHLSLKFSSNKTVLKVRGEVQRCMPLDQAHGSEKKFLIGVKFFGTPANLAKIFMEYL